MIRVAGIVNDSIVDGPGLRTSVFVQGCPHHCEGCHNTHTFDPCGGYDYDADTIARQIILDPLVAGVTLSGGEPMCQAKALAYLAGRISRAGKNVVLYTGYTYEYLIEEQDPDRIELLRQCDILIDGPYIKAERDLTLLYRGSRNQRILDCKKSLELQKAVIYDIK